MTAERPEAAATADMDCPQPTRVFITIKIAAEIADELAQMARGLERFRAGGSRQQSRDRLMQIVVTCTIFLVNSTKTKNSGTLSEGGE